MDDSHSKNAALRNGIDIKIAVLNGQASILEEHASALRYRICDLQVERNRLAPVSCLPNEILQGIFRHVRASSPTACIIRITHVCRRWRRVAINQAELWAHITANPPSIVPTLLERSRSAQLAVTIKPNFKFDPGNLPMVLAEEKLWKDLSKGGDRIAHLDIHRHLTEDSRSALERMTWSAPVLHTLCLTDLSETEWLTELKIGGSSRVRNGAPNLRTMKLANCSIAWTSPASANLTTLHIRAQWTPHDILTGAKILDALGSMKRLTELEIDGYNPYLANVPEDRVVALSSLRTFKYVIEDFHFGFNDRHGLLEHVAFPEATNVSVGFSGDCDIPQITRTPIVIPRRLTDSSYSTVANSSSTRSSPAFTISPLESIEISFLGWDSYPEEGVPYFECYAWPGHVDFAELPNRNLCYFLTEKATSSATCKAFFDAVGAADLRYLCLAEWGFDFKGMEEPFSCFPSVEELFVREWGTFSWYAYLSKQSSKPANESALLLPSLKKVAFEGMPFQSDLHCKSAEWTTGTDAVRDMVEQRIKLGRRIEILRFVECWNMSRAQVSDLETVVGKVVVERAQWDEKRDITRCTCTGCVEKRQAAGPNIDVDACKL